MYVLILDTETTGLFPRGAASTPLQPPLCNSLGGRQAPTTQCLQPPLCPSAPRGAARTPEGATAEGASSAPLNPTVQGALPLRPPPCKSFTEGAPIPNNQQNNQPNQLDTLPYAVQISYAIIDTSSPVFPIVEDYDAIIRISEETPLPEESVKIHGITREMIRAKGVPIEHVLSILQRSLDTYDIQLVVGHNIAFDLRVLDTEYSRQGPPSSEGASSAHYAVLQPPLCPSPSPSSSPDPTSTPGGDEHPLQPLRADKYLKKSLVPTQAGGLRGQPPRDLMKIRSLCTARESVGVCNLRVESMYGGTYLKFGKLGQVFEILFKERDAARGVDMKVFEKYMHNSRVDVLMCARVYVWLCYSVDVFDAWYREMQNYADEEFINVDDAHLVGGVENPRGGGKHPLRSASTPSAQILYGGGDNPQPLCADSNPESSASPVRVRGASPLASPRRSDRLRLKRMRMQEQEQEQVSVLVY